MKFIVTGAAGFIGSHLVDQLLRNGNFVIGLDNLSTGSMKNLFSASQETRFRFMSVQDDNLSTYLEMCGDGIDGVFHLGASVGVKNVSEYPLNCYLNNVRSTMQLVDYCLVNDCPIVFTSSSEIYGLNSDLPLAENSSRIIGNPPGPRWYYAESKMFGENLITAYQNERGLKGTIARLFNTAGPRQIGDYGMVIPRFFDAALRNLPIEIYGNGDQTRVFCHVYDIVEGLILMMSNEVSFGKIFNLGGIERVSIIDLAEKILQITKSKSNISWVGNRVYSGVNYIESANRVPDVSAAMKILDWYPKRALQEIINDFNCYATQRGGGTCLTKKPLNQ